MKSPLVIYYDGFCILCSKAMDFSVKHDHNKVIHYSPIQSDYAKRTLDKKYIDEYGKGDSASRIIKILN